MAELVVTMTHGTSKRMERATFASGIKKPSSASQKRGFAPQITKGNDFVVTIQELGHNGDGVVYLEGFTVFVPNTDIGEKVKIKIVEVKKTIAFAIRLK